ncbi:Ubiquitin carboxyl-terminal hydrolase 2 [Smittium culicis]|uniref:Ubiquitin carboxyl-terminal hydrolase 2 n=1 Tax=Smittium culicis TaxID=133412 RepID=A0A1R1Y7R6_9FUNG|nr:Ubiquitin carboxyl-terminal hydrolase 2 [Smittium culicis]
MNNRTDSIGSASDLIKRFEALNSFNKNNEKTPDYQGNTAMNFNKSYNPARITSKDYRNPTSSTLTHTGFSTDTLKRLNINSDSSFESLDSGRSSNFNNYSKPFVDLMGLNFNENNKFTYSKDSVSTKVENSNSGKKDLTLGALHSELSLISTEKLVPTNTTDIISILALEARIDPNISASTKSWTFSAKSLYESNVNTVMSTMDKLKKKIIDNELNSQKSKSSMLTESAQNLHDEFIKKYPEINPDSLYHRPTFNYSRKSSLKTSDSEYLAAKIKKFNEIEDEFIKSDSLIPNSLKNSFMPKPNDIILSFFPLELSDLLYSPGYIKKNSIMIIDVRPQNEFTECHIKYDFVVNIDPTWLSPGSCSVYSISQKLEPISKFMYDTFCNFINFSKIIYMDESSTSLSDSPHDPIVKKSKTLLLQTLLSMLQAENSSIAQNTYLLSGGIKAWINELGPSCCSGKNIIEGHNNHTRSQVSFSSNPSQLSSNLSSESIKPLQSSRNKRQGTILSENDAAVIAKTVKSNNLRLPEHSRSLYDFFKRKDGKSDSVSSKTYKNIHTNSGTAYQSTHENSENYPSNGITSPFSESKNHELYYVIGRQSDSIKNGLNNGYLPESGWNESKALKRKSIFDNPLNGFTSSDNRKLFDSKPVYNENTFEPTNTSNHANSALESTDAHQNILSEYQISNNESPISVQEPIIEHPKILSKPTDLTSDISITTTNNNDYLNSNNSNTTNGYLHIKDQLGINSKFNSGTIQIQRATSSGPHSNYLGSSAIGPPIPPKNMDSINSPISHGNYGLETKSSTLQSNNLQVSDALSSTNNQLLRRSSPIYSRPTDKIGLTGLKNFGNTCYINSVIQCLSSTLPFARFFLTGLWRRDCSISRSECGFAIEAAKDSKSLPKIVANSNESRPLLKQRQYSEALISEFSSVIDQLWNSQSSSLSPISLVNFIKKAIPVFKGNDQQDSQEFTSYFLDIIHNTLNTAKKRYSHSRKDSIVSDETKRFKKIVEKKREFQFELLPDLIQSEKKWKEYTDSHWSIVTSIFQGQLQSRVTCANCGHKSSSYSPFTELSIPIPLPKNPQVATKSGDKVDSSKQVPHQKSYNKNYSNLTVDISDCLSKFVEPEYLDVDNEWLCSSCNTKSAAKKTITVSKLPLVLILHIKRFSFDGPFRDKLETMVNYPLRGLDLSPYCIPEISGGQSPQVDSKNLYHLYGVVNHMGSLSGGHYTSSVFNGLRNEWNYFNDTRVSQISESKVVSPAAYLLFFVRDQA